MSKMDDWELIMLHSMQVLPDLWKLHNNLGVVSSSSILGNQKAVGDQVVKGMKFDSTYLL